MNRMILPLVLALMIMPLALADAYRTANTPGITGSPAVYASQARAGASYQAPPLYVPEPMGVTRDVRFLPPVSQDQLQLDENGVVTNQANDPVAYGTSGGVFDTGHNPWALKVRNQVGPYFSDNQQGFKTGMVQTNAYQKWGGKSFLTHYLGYKAPIQVLKQWSGGMTGSSSGMVFSNADGKYYNPGLPKLVKPMPQYVNPGIPAQTTPGSVQPGVAQ